VNTFFLKLREVQERMSACRLCPDVVGPPVHGPAVRTSIFLLGQAPGPREAGYGRPFAYTAGKTLFRWFDEASGVDESQFREHVYMAAVARCFPGKAKGGGDRIPSPLEAKTCGRYLQEELAILQPKLLIAVGKLAIAHALGPEKMGPNTLLTAVVGKNFQTVFHGALLDVVCLPHPSGLSSWHKTEPGITLLKKSLKLIVNHSAWAAEFH
jgi:uracil-DNA glycosylase